MGKGDASEGAGEEVRAWAKEAGIIQGDGTGMHYEQPVTREQMVTLLHRLWKIMKK